jgi:purine-binding chemotaxis protein CheW
MKEIVIFSLAQEFYGVDIKKVKGIIVYSQLIITPLFNEKEWIIGISNIRGEVIPIIDLRKRFANVAKYNDDTVVIIIFTEEGKWMGIVVDFILRIDFVDTSNIKQPNLLKGVEKKYLEGFIKTQNDEMVTLLNIDLLLDVKEI